MKYINFIGNRRKGVDDFLIPNDWLTEAPTSNLETTTPMEDASRSEDQ